MSLEDIILPLIPVFFGWILGVGTTGIPRIYAHWKYQHVRTMYFRLLKRKYNKTPRNEKPLGWTCHGGLEPGLHESISEILTDCDAAYRNKNWELLEMLVTRAYKLSKCQPVKPKSWRFWRWRREEKRVYTSFYYCFRFFKSFNSLYHIVSKDRNSILDFLTSNEPIQEELEIKYTEYQTKSEVFGFLSATISWGYELEDPRSDQALLYKPFFRYNKTLKKLRQNFQNDPDPSKENLWPSSKTEDNNETIKNKRKFNSLSDQ